MHQFITALKKKRLQEMLGFRFIRVFLFFNFPSRWPQIEINVLSIRRDWRACASVLCHAITLTLIFFPLSLNPFPRSLCLRRFILLLLKSASWLALCFPSCLLRCLSVSLFLMLVSRWFLFPGMREPCLCLLVGGLKCK